MFIIYDKDMNVKPFPKGVHPLDIYISSIPKRRETEEIEGSNRVVNKGFTYTPRPIDIRFMLNSYDTQDYRLLRDEVYAYLQEDEYFYISEIYQKGKRYKVTVADSFIPERASQTSSSLSIPLQTYVLPFGESIATTQQIQKNSINANDEIWSYGLGLVDDPNLHKYTWEGNTAVIYNAGNVAIHPYEQDLKITISNVKDSTDYFELRNTTNNTVFHVNEPINSTDTIVIDGGSVTKNGLAFLRSTSKEFIELKKGQNNFIINGATSAKVEFDFRFYYL